jgi:hypothetical protein
MSLQRVMAFITIDVLPFGLFPYFRPVKAVLTKTAAYHYEFTADEQLSRA